MTTSIPRVALLLAVALASAACSRPIELEWKHDLGGASVSTPLVTDKYIAVGTELGLTILEISGQRRCTFNAHGEVISAPKTDGKRIFFGSPNYNFYAVTPDCKEVWNFPTRDRIKSDPLVVGNLVYMSSYDGHVYALKGEDGSQVWIFPNPAPKGSEQEEAPAEPDPAKKKKVKKAQEGPEDPPPPPKPTPPKDIGDFSYSSPFLDRGVLYLGNLDSRLYALDAQTGEYLWHFDTDGPVTSSPVVLGNTAFFGSNDGNIYAVNIKNHRARWTVTTKEWVNSSPRIVDRVLYIGGNDRTVLAIDAQTGEGIWTFNTDGPAIAIPAIYEDLVFAAGGSGDGKIYALQRSSGALFWKFETGGKIQSDPVLVGDLLYVSSTDHFLYAFRIKQTKAP